MTTEQIIEILTNWDRYQWEEDNFQNFVAHLKICDLNTLPKELKEKAEGILAKEEEKILEEEQNKLSFEEINTILGKWEKLEWEPEPYRRFLRQLKTIDINSLDDESRVLARKLLVGEQGRELAEKRSKIENKDKKKAKNGEKQTDVNGAIILIAIFAIGAGIYFGWPYAENFVRDGFAIIDKWIDPNKDVREDPEIPKAKPEPGKTVTDPNEEMSADELLKALIIPTNYKLDYIGSISVTINNTLSRVNMTMETQRNEIPQVYTESNIYVNSAEILFTQSYGYLEDNQLALYSYATEKQNTSRKKQWYKTTTTYYDSSVSFVNILSNYGTSERVKNSSSSDGLLNIIKVTIPYKYFKNLMVQDPSVNSLTFDSEKNVTITLYINADTYTLTKYEVNYNECALNYGINKIHSYTETVQYSSIGKIGPINLPNEVLANLIIIN